MSAATSPNRNLRAARWYAERGLAVFPLVPRTKVPQAGSHGELDGTTDAATIDKMWEGRPHLLIAVALRSTPFFVVDADARHCGDEWLRSFPALPHTATCISGSGWPSTHHYFRRTPELEEVRTRKLVPPGGFCTGIDLKGLRAGYVVLPPSLHPWGRRYEWEASARFGEVPIPRISAGVARSHDQGDGDEVHQRRRRTRRTWTPSPSTSAYCSRRQVGSVPR